MQELRQKFGPRARRQPGGRRSTVPRLDPTARRSSARGRAASGTAAGAPRLFAAEREGNGGLQSARPQDAGLAIGRRGTASEASA